MCWGQYSGPRSISYQYHSSIIGLSGACDLLVPNPSGCGRTDAAPRCTGPEFELRCAGLALRHTQHHHGISGGREDADGNARVGAVTRQLAAPGLAPGTRRCQNSIPRLPANVCFAGASAREHHLHRTGHGPARPVARADLSPGVPQRAPPSRVCLTVAPRGGLATANYGYCKDRQETVGRQVAVSPAGPRRRGAARRCKWKCDHSETHAD